MASIKKVGDNRWRVSVFLGRRNGKMRRLCKVIHGTKRDAEVFAREKESLRDLGKLETLPEKITLRKWLKKWLEYKKENVRSQTFESYKVLVETHLETACFVDKLLSDIKPLHIQEFYDDLTKTRSARTVQYIHSILSNAFERAVSLEYIERNPCKLTTRPVNKRKKFKVLNIEEANRFLEAAGYHKYHVLFVVALTLGLRPSEYLALQWSDFDEDNKTLKIERTYYENKSESYWCFEAPKTDCSQRVIRLSASQVNLFKIQQKRVKAIKAAAEAEGIEFSDFNLIFPSEVGTPLRINNLTRRAFRPLLEAAGLDSDYRLYSLRHACASILLAKGEKIKVIADILGHTDVKFTMQTYVHVLGSMKEEASERIEEAFFSQNQLKMMTGFIN